MAAEELEESLFFLLLVARVDELLGFGEILRGQLALHFHKALYEGLVLLEELVVALGHGAGDDERRTGIVDEYGVDLVDDGIVVAALHEVLGAHGHVVAQVVEAELVVRTEGDVGLVGAAALFGVGLVLVDAVHGEAVEHVERAHPLGVTLGEVVIDRHHVYTVAREGVEEYGERGHEGLAFTRCHFGNLSLGQHDAAEELHVVVYHFPLQVVAAGHPVVLVDGLLAFDAHEVVRGGEFAVEVGGRHFDFFVLREAASRVLHDGEGFGHHLREGLFHAVEHLSLELVDLVEDDFAVFDGRFFDFSLELFDFLLQVVGRILHLGLELFRLGAERVVVEGLDGGVSLLHLVYVRRNEFLVARRLVAEKFAEDFIDIHELGVVI